MEKKKAKKTAHVGDAARAGAGADADADAPWGWLTNRGLVPTFSLISLFGLLVRAAVSLHPYSGAGTPPKYGDFEAQRHWMEITVNLPARDWYVNGTLNDLAYWGLDYPPLTAYQSYVHGLFLKLFDPDAVALFASRGYETYFSKLLMRWTVLSSDVMVFFPAVFYFWIVYNRGRSRGGERCDAPWHVAMLLINPCLILIDHGHFQYNCISLGLTVGAVAAVLSQKDLIACALFSLALNHKQMSAYFAPAFFSHLLGKCLRRKNPFFEVSRLGLVVMGTFAVVWLPYLYSTDALLQVLSRLAPFERGIYEDYVANFWCATSVLIKWKRLFLTPKLKLFSFIMTLSTCLPSMIHQISSPSSQGFLYGLLNSSLPFYLFSFQVHEKSILLPLLPASLLALDNPSLYKWLTHYGLLSMFPLLHRDGLLLPYITLNALYFLLYHVPRDKRVSKVTGSSAAYPILSAFSVCCYFGLHLIYLTMHPPEKYPFLFEALIMIFCFFHFALLAIYTNKKQWTLSKHSMLLNKEKKLI